MSTLDSQSLTNTAKSNWTHTRSSFTNHISPAIPDKLYNTAPMARLFSDCTSAILFVLLGLAASIMLATSAPTVQRVHVRQATSTKVYLNSGVRLTVSYCNHVFCSSKPMCVRLDGMVSAVCTPWRHILKCNTSHYVVILPTKIIISNLVVILLRLSTQFRLGKIIFCQCFMCTKGY